MAVGWLGAALAGRVDETGLLELPEPPEFLALWQQAIGSTYDEAEAEARQERRNRAALTSSVADVTEGDRLPTEIEQIEITSMAQAHYETYQRLAGKTFDWEELDPAVRGVMTATIADMVRSGVVVPGPASTRDPSARFGVFDATELSEIVIALDHRLAEAEDGNAYVYYDTAATLEEQASRFVGDEPRPRVTREELDAAAGAPQTLYAVFTNRPGPGVRQLVTEAIDGTDDHTPLGQVLGKIMAAAGSGCEFVEIEDERGRGAGPSVGVDWTQDGPLWKLGPFRLPHRREQVDPVTIANRALPNAPQAEAIAHLRETGLFAGVSDTELWQAAVRVGERHGPGTAMRDPAAVARELGRRSTATPLEPGSGAPDEG
jgi:hypothetical protein